MSRSTVPSSGPSTGSSKGRAPHVRSLIARRVIYLLVVIGGAYYAASQAQGDDLAGILVPLVLAIGLNLLPLFWTEESDPFEPASYNGIYFAMGLIASVTSVMAAGKIDFKYLPAMGSVAKGELAEIVGWSYALSAFSYLVGYYLPRQKRAANAYSFFPKVAGIRWNSKRVGLVALVCFGIAIPIYIFFQRQLGTDLSDVTELAKGKAVWRDDPTRTWVLRGMMLAYLPVLLLLAKALEERSLGSTLVAIGLALLVGLLVLRAGQRSLTITLFVLCGIVFHYMRRRIPTGLLVAVGFVVLVASNVLVEFRRHDDPGRANVSMGSDRFDPTTALSEHEEDRQRFSTMAVIFYYFPDKQDFLLGESWVGLIALPIPRWIWADKAKSFVWRDSNIMPHLIREPVPVPFHGVLYANFSWIGIVLGNVLWGRLQGRMYDWLKAAKGDKNVVLLYASAVLITSPMLLPLTFFTQFVLPVWLIIQVVGYRSAGALAVPEPALTAARAADTSASTA